MEPIATTPGLREVIAEVRNTIARIELADRAIEDAERAPDGSDYNDLYAYVKQCKTALIKVQAMANEQDDLLRVALANLRDIQNRWPLGELHRSVSALLADAASVGICLEG